MMTDIIPGKVYDIFTCCTQEHTTAKSSVVCLSNRTTKVRCSIHGGDIVDKKRICPNCNRELRGMQIKPGRACQYCSNPTQAYRKIREHPRGAYCKFYKKCKKKINCWYCEEFDPIFPNTGPKRRVKNGKKS